MKTKYSATLIKLTFFMFLVSVKPAISQDSNKNQSLYPKKHDPMMEFLKNESIRKVFNTPTIIHPGIIKTLWDIHSGTNQESGRDFKSQELLEGEHIDQPDSIFIYSAVNDTSKQLFEYDELERETILTVKNWNNHTWNNSIQRVKSYSPNGKLYTMLYKDWYFSDWMNSDLYTYTYNNSGLIQTYLTQSWNATFWANTILNTYTYDGNGRRLTTLIQDWENSVWTNTNLQTLTYDGNGEIFTDVSQVWESNSWVNSYQTNYSYDPAGLWKKATFQYWDGSAWVNQSIDAYTFDASGNILSYTIQYWDGSSWQNQDKVAFTYNTNNLLLSMIQQTWDGSSWLNLSNNTYTYDGDGFELTNLYQTWSGNWVNYSLTSLTYNSNHNCETLEYQLWGGSSWGNSQKVNYDYTDGRVLAISQHWNGTNWVDSDWNITIELYNNGNPELLYAGFNNKIDAYYSSFNTGFNEPLINENKAFRVYPNPVRSDMRIETQLNQSEKVNFRLVDLSGKPLGSLFEGTLPQGKNSLKVSVSSLKPGFYLLEMKTNNEVFRQKICIIK